MVKVFAYTFITIFFIIFVVFSPKNANDRSKYRLHTRRLGYKFPKLAFDPLVTKIERLVEERGLRNDQNTIVDPLNLEDNKAAIVNAVDQDTYDYYDDRGRLNITLRLTYLFPMIDIEPIDGYVSLDELKTWNIQQAEDRLTYRTIKEYKLRDKDQDGHISFSEYLPQFSQSDIERNDMEHGQAGWWKQQYENADADRSGSLDFDEFNNFLHPEDSTNEEIQKWVLREKIRTMDYNLDGKLDLDEFRDRTYATYKSYIQFETAGEIVPPAQNVFDLLDKNRDGYLDAEELRPIFSYLQPGEFSYAQFYSTYLVREADDNKDNKLSLDEMLNHDRIFYNTIYDEGLDDEYDDGFRDEL